MKTVKASFLLLDRDDGVLVPGKVVDDDWQFLDVELEDGLELKDVMKPDVAMLQGQTENKMRFVKFDHKKFHEQFDAWEKQGWHPIGFDMVRFYPTVEAFEAAQEE